MQLFFASQVPQWPADGEISRPAYPTTLLKLNSTWRLPFPVPVHNASGAQRVAGPLQRRPAEPTLCNSGIFCCHSRTRLDVHAVKLTAARLIHLSPEQV